jgi:hypothetical protein
MKIGRTAAAVPTAAATALLAASVAGAPAANAYATLPPDAKHSCMRCTAMDGSAPTATSSGAHNRRDGGFGDGGQGSQGRYEGDRRSGCNPCAQPELAAQLLNSTGYTNNDLRGMCPG